MKKIVPFIIILSLLVPFLPSFDFTLYALPYTPSESENSWIEDLEVKFQTYLGNNGIVANSDWFNTDYVGGFWNDVLNYLGFEPIQDKDFASSVYDYSLQNNISADMLFTDSSQYILNQVNNELNYDFIKTLHTDEFYNKLLPLGNSSFINGWIQNFFTRLKPLVNANSSLVFVVSCTQTTPFTRLDIPIYGLDRSLFSDYSYSFYSKSGTLLPVFREDDSGFARLNSSAPVPGGVWFVSGNQIVQSVPAKKTTINGNSNTQSGVSDVSLVQNQNIIFEGVRFYLERDYIYFYGSCLLVADNVDNFYIPIFKSNGDAQLFYSGQSTFYKFDSNLDLGEFGYDIDYSRLYDLISSTVQGNTENVLDSINNVANHYLQQQLDLLHDINNALNDGNGQSWLRRIYGILDYNFPLTLDSFEDLIYAVQNISVSGGGDFSEATHVLHEIDTKLGILIDEPFTDLTDTDWNQMKSRIQTKFPFCIFSDIVAISVILNRPPQQPDLNFPIPIIGSESENVVHIDLSPYEHARPFVHGALIFVFIIGLLALSVKIFDHLKS